MKVKILNSFPKETYNFDNVWFSSDFHLNHDAVIKFGRKFEGVTHMNNHILVETNKLVRGNDLLVLMGDTMMGEKDYTQFLNSLICDNVIIIYGNHCFDKNTEVLTKTGFKLFKDLKEYEEVGSFDKETLQVVFEKPIDYFSERYKGNIITLKNGFTEQSVTSQHNVVVQNSLKKADSVGEKDINNIPLFGYLNNEDYDISDDMLRLIVNVVCDATIIDYRKYLGESSNKRVVQFKLSKKRKIENLKNILNRLDIPFTLNECKKDSSNKLQPYYIKIFGNHARNIFNILKDKKQFPSFFRDLSKKQVKVVIEELSITDGHITDDKIHLTSINKKDIDIVQEICILNGIKCVIKEYVNKTGYDNAKLQYRLRIDTHSKQTLSKKEVSQYNDLVYCVTTSKGTVITRKNGKVAFSGNCNRGKLLGVAEKLIYVGDYLELNIDNQITCCSHFPMFNWNYQDDGSYHLHGHLHGDENSVVKEIHKYRSMDVGIDSYYNMFGEYSLFSFERVKELFKDKLIIGRHEN